MHAEQLRYDTDEPFTEVELYLFEEGLSEEEYLRQLSDSYVVWEDEDIC